MRPPSAEELRVERLGPGRFPSPLLQAGGAPISEPGGVLWSADQQAVEALVASGQPLPSFEQAGPRAELFFDPSELGTGVVTCGGLCPGLNDVIASITRCLWEEYRVRRIYGFRYGFAGLVPQSGHVPMSLDPDSVAPIHNWGGSILGSSRGPQNVTDMVDELCRRQVGVLFVVGGDGTLRGGGALCAEIARRKLPIAVVGVPKTIDNDLAWIDRSFGFSSAVGEARRAVNAAHTEAIGAWNGVSVVKLMGRHSGFIAAHACLADSDADFCLIPEVPFSLRGARGFLSALERRLERKRHAVIVVAEGAGQELLPETGGTDASGNRKLADIGTYLRDEIISHFSRAPHPVAVRYIDPSYILRGLPANSVDSELCLRLGQAAVHAGLSGRTNVIVGHWNQAFVHVPIALATTGRRQVDPEGELWRTVLASTGQPASMLDPSSM